MSASAPGLSILKLRIGADCEHIMGKTRGHEYQRGSLQDDSSSQLISLTLTALNRRHLAQVKRGVEPRLLSEYRRTDVQALVRWMTIKADEIFAGTYTDTMERPPLSQHRLRRQKLVDSMEHRAIWIIKRWDRMKVEGRRRGGLHSAADGVRKGKPPRWTHADIRPFLDLPAGERKEKALGLGMSQATFYRLLKAAPEVEERIAQRHIEDALIRPSDAELDALLDGVDLTTGEVIEAPEEEAHDVIHEMNPVIDITEWQLDKLRAAEVAERLQKADAENPDWLLAGMNL